jgi:Transposase DDE domain
MTQLQDLYTDYLISTTQLATVTTASEVLGISKDKLSRFLGGVELFTTNQLIDEVEQKKGCVKDHTAFNNQDLWKMVKSEVRESEKIEPAVLIVDDTIIAKPCSDENDIICWHSDHKTGQSVKGINLLNGGLYYSIQSKYVPIFAELIAKTEKYIETKKDPKTGLEKYIEKRKSPITKNKLFQNNFNQIMKNHIKINYVLMDSWFSSVDNLNFIQGHKQNYICPLKSNRKLALSFGEKKQGKWYKLEQITNQLETQTTLPIWLESCTHICYLTKQVFNNTDGSSVTMYLITNDQTLTKDQIHATYELRWKVEEFHKSLKSNLSLEKSPTKHKTSQSNHIFYSITAFFKLELLTKTTATKHKNHFQLKASLYVKALKTALDELGKLKMLVSGCER